MGDGRDASYKVSGRRYRPRFVVGGADAVEEEREAMPFLEEGENELGAGVARSDPA